jgi:hypothetical protein
MLVRVYFELIILQLVTTTKFVYFKINVNYKN